MAKIAVVSPGKMGRSIGMTLQKVGHEIYFPSHDRSEETVNKALSCGFTRVEKIHDLADTCDAIICIGTRDIAFVVPQIVFMETNFKGLYIDLNSLNGEEEENKWRSMMDNLTDKYLEGAVRGYPFEKDEETRPSTHMIIFSGDSSNIGNGLFQGTIWNVQYSKTHAKVVNRYMAMCEKTTENEPLYQDKLTAKNLAWEQAMLDLIADKFYIDGRTGAEAMVEVWQQIRDGKIRNICAELGFPEHLGLLHAINRFGKNITANRALDKVRSDRSTWHDPEVLKNEDDIR